MVEPVSLPWKRPRKGLVVAEAGASFRVEREEEGWMCTVMRGSKRQVLAKGLARQREGLCRAEVAAASMPEVQAALSEQSEAPAATPKAAKAVGRRGKRRGPKGRATKRDEAPKNVRDPKPAKKPRRSKQGPGGESSERAAAFERVVFEPVEDGCICGKVGEVTWVADPAGQVVFTGEVESDEAARVRSAANEHFAATHPSVSVQEQDSPQAPSKRGRAAKRGRGKKRADQGKTDATATPKKPASKAEAATTRAPKRARAGAPPRKATTKSKGEDTKDTGNTTALRWVEVDGQLRASTPLGSYAIVREGEKDELYFYDLNGTSRHIRGTGDPKRLAAQLAARGETGPSIQTPAPDLQAQMMMAFLNAATEAA